MLTFGDHRGLRDDNEGIERINHPLQTTSGNGGVQAAQTVPLKVAMRHKPARQLPQCRIGEWRNDRHSRNFVITGLIIGGRRRQLSHSQRLQRFAC